MMRDNQPGAHQVRLSLSHAERLHRFAGANGLSEAAVVERALDMLFSLAELIGDESPRRSWSAASTDALMRVWDNGDDAIYDDWRTLYAVSAG